MLDFNNDLGDDSGGDSDNEKSLEEIKSCLLVLDSTLSQIVSR